VCLVFRQNGGDSFLQEEENTIPQLFHIPMWIRQKNFSEQGISGRDTMREEEKQTKIYYGTQDFEKRKHLRFPVVR
jgi:hypothetical protein